MRVPGQRWCEYTQTAKVSKHQVNWYRYMNISNICALCHAGYQYEYCYLYVFMFSCQYFGKFVLKVEMHTITGVLTVVCGELTDLSVY